ncbi:hypothetical protein lam_300 [Candidatus Liberibacter americanus str. Sao Paulo]|uniref:Permease n=2 Tax=Candidatus Liberibacter americanus TaxID=309868 RepID=U6B725_9HYPH|nr:hypothetical protein lam_300 [Candidatus Liberibacter americanus str. Sao Paulo]EMS36380.1 putative permease [Candidatus Liberibacter americanus PW_SP]
MLLGILWRYFFKYYMKITVYFLSSIIILLFVIDLDEMKSQMDWLPGYSSYECVLLVLTRIPLIIQQTIPFIILIINMITFFNINRKNETVITRAMGISIWQFLSPFLIGSFILGMCMVLIINPLAVYGEKVGRSIVKKWAEEKKHVTIPWAHIKDKQKEIFISADNISEKEKILSNVVVITINKEDYSIIRQNAEYATIDHKMITLKNVNNYKHGSNPLYMDSVIINYFSKIDVFDQFNGKLQSVSLYDDIKNIIYADKTNTFNSNLSETKFYFLITTPIMLIAMTLIAASVSLEFNRSGKLTITMIYGIISGFMLYTTLIIMKSFGKNGILIPTASASIPIISTISLSILTLLRKEDG